LPGASPPENLLAEPEAGPVLPLNVFDGLGDGLGLLYDRLGLGLLYDRLGELNDLPPPLKPLP
jgi:hypothetical protein